MKVTVCGFMSWLGDFLKLQMCWEAGFSSQYKDTVLMHVLVKCDSDFNKVCVTLRGGTRSKESSKKRQRPCMKRM